MRSGRNIPDRIANAPELQPHLEFFLVAFFDLDSERQSGFGIGPIPITAILQYCRHYRITGIEEEEFIFYIKELDSAFLKFAERKQKKESHGRANRSRKKNATG